MVVMLMVEYVGELLCCMLGMLGMLVVEYVDG